MRHYAVAWYRPPYPQVYRGRGRVVAKRYPEAMDTMPAAIAGLRLIYAHNMKEAKRIFRETEYGT